MATSAIVVNVYLMRRRVMVITTVKTAVTNSKNTAHLQVNHHFICSVKLYTMRSHLNSDRGVYFQTGVSIFSYR